MMRVITKQDLINGVADKWYATYHQKDWYDEDMRGIWLKLADLSAAATEQEVTTIIGNPSWTDIECTECRSSVDWVVVLADDEVELCRDCIRKLAALAQLNRTCPVCGSDKVSTSCANGCFTLKLEQLKGLL